MVTDVSKRLMATVFRALHILPHLSLYQPYEVLLCSPILQMGTCSTEVVWLVSTQLPRCGQEAPANLKELKCLR